DLDVEARLRVDLREVALDVVLVARGQLLVAHDLLDDRLVLLIDVLVAARREALLRGGEDRLAARGALRAHLTLEVGVLGVARLVRRIAGQIGPGAGAPLLAALAAVLLA